MSVCKRNKINFKNAIKSAAIFAVVGLLSACGDDSGSGSDSNRDSDSSQFGNLDESADSDVMVDTFDDLPVCSGKREGKIAYVKDEKAAYVCENGDWTTDKDSSGDGKVNSSSSDERSTQSSSEIPASSSAENRESSGNDADSPQGFVRENISVTGVAQKGPFQFGSPLNLYELKSDLMPSGREYNDEISSNKGDFVIPKVSLVYPYVKLEVRGLYRNEVTGKWSADSMTLRAVTDFSDKRTEVNVNLLTHLEYDRVLYLVQEKGYSVYAAKKQAAQEIMTAFEFATAVTYSEDFAIFQNEGVSAGTIAGNGTLLAISALVMADRSDAKIQSFIDKFREDIKTDGEWNDLQTKADMADWAYNFDYSSIRASVKSWNILDIPDYETYLDIYWNNVYGLGGCSVNRKDVVAPNSNKLSKYYNKYFICNSAKWVEATTLQKDTYEWHAGKEGDFEKGNVTDTVYVYDGSKWVFAKRETALGICGIKNVGVVSKFDNVNYICSDNAWKEATVLEYDTYGKVCLTDGSIVAGVVVSSNKYVCDAGNFRVAKAQEISLDKGCVSYTDGMEIRKSLSSAQDSVYLCNSGLWNGSIETNEGYFFDSRDGQFYKSVTIGTQIWMAENLNYRTADSYCYNDSVKYCDKYGRLYIWSAAIRACPSGWHLPSNAEWKKLFSAVGDHAGKLLKSQSGWFDNGNGVDTFGFSALPAGERHSYGGTCGDEGKYTRFWSSTEQSKNCNAYYVGWWYYENGGDLSYTGQNFGFSVRCVKD